MKLTDPSSDRMWTDFMLAEEAAAERDASQLRDRLAFLTAAGIEQAEARQAAYENAAAEAKRTRRDHRLDVCLVVALCTAFAIGLLMLAVIALGFYRTLS